MTQSLDDLELNIEETRARLDRTIGSLHERLSVSEIADELAGSLRTTQFGSVVGAALDAAKRNPLAVILVAAGVGWLVHRVRQDGRANTSYRRIEDEAAAIPVLNTGNARIYDPDLSLRHPSQDSLGSRHEMSARI